MTGFLINPGAGPVAGANVRSARANIKRFVQELGLEGVAWREGLACDDGRWPFILSLGHRKVRVDMPGVPLARVRYELKDNANPLLYPRLYVDGNSFWWPFAVGVARDHLTGENER